MSEQLADAARTVEKAATFELIAKQKAEVLANIEALEKRINQLNAQLQQDNANLLASRGAILAFDSLVERLSTPPPTPAPPA